jgi:hypothetical protein
MPKEILKDGIIISQFAQLTRKDQPNAQKITVSCTVQVGNPDGVYVREFRGTESADYATQN